MPGFDGTGPDGKGELTGRGFGNCVRIVKDGVKTIFGVGRGGIPRGGGRGRMFGGRNRRNNV